MKALQLFLIVFATCLFSQDIRSIQLFNPQTNDETPVIGFNEKLVLKFDDFSNSSKMYRYTLKHFDRNWEDDGLFNSEYASGNINGLINEFQYSFNTLQRYTQYTLVFPNEKVQPKISGNFELIVFLDSAEKPLFKKRFYVVENGARLAFNISRITDPKNPNNNQRVEVQAVSNGADLTSNLNAMTLNIIQNNNSNIGVFNVRPGSALGNQVVFQQMELCFPGNNEFYYFDNKIIDQPADMVAATQIIEGQNHNFLHPVWAYPLNYQYQPDVNGAFYFRRSDLGIERNADSEADYAWVYFYLDSEKMDKELHILGAFNDYFPTDESKMFYDEISKKYTAKIYLKQGFYNYQIATKDADGRLNFGEVNGNFWQTENMYQGFLYYKPFGRNFDGLIGYGETRNRR